MLGMALRLRGMAPGSSLRALARTDRALIHETFSSSEAFASCWTLGPSAPPPRRPSYSSLCVHSEDVSSASVSSRVDFDLPLAPGCRVVERVPAAGREGEADESGAWQLPAEGVRRRELVVLARAPDVASASARLARLLRRPSSTGTRWWVQSLGSFASPPFLADGAALRLVHHPAWDAAPPRSFLRLHGGWRMNFTGAVRDFGPTALRPSRVTFRVRLASACAPRSFFNVFFSSASDASHHVDAAVYYAGSRHAPPEPPDVCSFLLDTRTPRSTGCAAMLWLPSGVNAGTEGARTAALADAAGEGAAGAVHSSEWHTVVLDFDWQLMRMLCAVNGEPMLASGRTGPQEAALNFGPHAAMTALAESGQSTAAAAAAARHVADARLGFRRMYVFTWLDADSDRHASDEEGGDDAPEVHLADLWVE